MGRLYDLLSNDVRYQEGMTACINCGTCTAVCPAAEFYKYDPRQILDTVQTKNEEAIEQLLKSETIWYCGECMSCVTRCPRNNAPGLVILALRSLSQDLGYFIESEKGRQQLALKRTVGDWVLQHGYCVYARKVTFEDHPEAGLIWKWESEHLDDVFERLGANLDGDGPGVLRKIPQQSLDELQRIFEITGGIDRFEQIEKKSAERANELGLTNDEYFNEIYTTNNGEHMRD